jgi:hypothetical protein
MSLGCTSTPERRDIRPGGFDLDELGLYQHQPPDDCAAGHLGGQDAGLDGDELVGNCGAGSGV